MFRGILPIGSVVKINNANIKVMVIGYMPQEADNPDNVHEYSGIIYPLGYQREDQIVQFDADQISAVEFIGLQDLEQMSFESILMEQMDSDDEEEDQVTEDTQSGEDA